ncbi:MAG: hypothetical protein E6H49_17685 [Betaproteobacteria bacterium]|nr:MAG: hypothetical protein E6H49_17685 [Betaproteobacteria bacterium]
MISKACAADRACRHPDKLVNLGEGRALVGGTGSEQRTGRNLFLNFNEEENMRKLISILVATVFAVSSGAALAASHAGAQPMKDDKKSEMKKSDKKADKKAKKAKKEPKKDEMKK